MKKLLLFLILFSCLNTNAQVCYGTVNISLYDTPIGVTTGDFNKDGKADIATANFNSDDVSILLGTGTGTFGAATNFLVQDGPRRLLSADLNNDGNLDLVVTNSYAFTISVLLGDGTGSFAAAVNYNTDQTPYSLVCADLNKDNILDVITSNVNSNDYSKFIGVGNGTFGAGISIAPSSASIGIALADFNKDGFPDIATTTGGIAISLNDSTGGFGNSRTYSYGVGSSLNALTTGDFNGDGNMDIASANKGSNNISVIYGLSSVADVNHIFDTIPASNFSTGTAPFDIVSADFNGDGKIDLATANSGSNDVSVLFNNGTGSFTSISTFQAGSSPYSIASSDFDSDGKADLVVANVNSGNISVLLSNRYALTVTTPQPVCGGTNITLTASGVTTYTWTNNLANTQTISVSPTVSTDYVVKGAVANCTYTDTVHVTVYPKPIISIQSTNVSCNANCNGTVLANVNSGTPPFGYNWYSTFYITNQPGITSLCADNYSCTVADNHNCKDTAYVTITQPLAATLTVTTTETEVTCIGGTDGSASATATGGVPPYAFTWNTTPAQNTATINNLPVANYTCTVQDANACVTTASVSVLQAAILYPNATTWLNPSATPQMWDMYVDYSINVTNATWYWGDGTSTDSLYPTHNYNTLGRYNICVTAFTICGDSVSSCVTDSIYRLANSASNNMIQVNVIDATSGISTYNTQNSIIKIYPNPTSNKITIDANDVIDIKLFDLVGKQIFTTKQNNIDVSNFNEGIYFIQVQTNQSTTTQKIIVQH